MAPSRRKTTTTANNHTRRMITRSIYKKQQVINTILEEEEEDSATRSLSSPSPSANTNYDTCHEDYDKENKTTCENDVVCCSTPRGKQNMIPKISTCPPAPKKKRLVGNHGRTGSTKFFSHPDLEVFFLFSSRTLRSLGSKNSIESPKGS